MIKLENSDICGWQHAIRGMRNPKNSWDRSDSIFDICQGELMGALGPNDHKLCMSLAAGGPVHAKYRRMITVYVDITAPLYWWKEFDTYKVGTVANSCSTMHKIHDKEFTIEDFSCENLITDEDQLMDDLEELGEKTKVRGFLNSSMDDLEYIIDKLNAFRLLYLHTKNKTWWWQMIQLLPSSYNQKRTVMLNYEVLVGMYRWRKDHKLDEWRTFCEWIESLPYAELITGPEFLNKDFNI